MKTILLILISIGVISSTSLLMVYGQEQTFDEFMEWCGPKFGEKCIEFYEEGSFTINKPSNNFEFGVVITVIVFTLMGYYIWRNEIFKFFNFFNICSRFQSFGSLYPINCLDN